MRWVCKQLLHFPKKFYKVNFEKTPCTGHFLRPFCGVGAETVKMFAYDVIEGRITLDILPFIVNFEDVVQLKSMLHKSK